MRLRNLNLINRSLRRLIQRNLIVRNIILRNIRLKHKPKKFNPCNLSRKNQAKNPTLETHNWMVKQKRLRICKFDHDIKNRFSRFTIPHGIVGPHLKRPGVVFRFTEIAHSYPVTESEGPHHERPLKMFREQKYLKFVQEKKTVITFEKRPIYLSGLTNRGAGKRARPTGASGQPIFQWLNFIMVYFLTLRLCKFDHDIKIRVFLFHYFSRKSRHAPQTTWGGFLVLLKSHTV